MSTSRAIVLAPTVRHADHAGPSLALLLRIKCVLLRNRLRQLIDQSPWRLLLVIVFVAVIWWLLYAIFNHVFMFMRKYDRQSAIAIPYVFHIFFVAMTALLSFSTAVLVYGALFARAEPSFLLAAPNAPRNIVAVMYLESLFFSSWSLVLMGLPLMLAIGNVQGLPWHFYLTFLLAFLGFVPIPGAFGLLAALAVALWLPKAAKQTLIYVTGTTLLVVILWWGRIWAISTSDSSQWLHRFLGELQFLKAALLPSTWVSHAIRFAIEEHPADAAFYLGATWATALFFSWSAVEIAGAKFLAAFGRAHTAPQTKRIYSGRVSEWLTLAAFFFIPPKMRLLILKDIRSFLRDPVQWSQLAILFGLLALYLIYLPKSRPEGFNLSWRALICFLNFGAVTLILSTFTSRFVFPLISMEGRQMWLVGLWPMSRSHVLWAKFLYALSVTAVAAMSVTTLSIRALNLPAMLAWVQTVGTLAVCCGLCGLAVGLGARMPSFRERDSGRIASGLGGTVNLVASVALVTLTVALMGWICYRLVETGSLAGLDLGNLLLFLGMVCLGIGTSFVAMQIGIRSFRHTEF